MSSNTITTVQTKIIHEYGNNVLHILNGNCLLEYFRENKLLQQNNTYIPFNEAVCWGEVTTDIFSKAFIEKRIKSLNTTINEYKDIVLDPLKPLFQNNFKTVVLWFGEDMFCQINMLTILAYLEKSGFSGNVLECIIDEDTYEVVDIKKNSLKGMMHLYKNMMILKQMPNVEVLPISKKVVHMYLNYRNQDSEINQYIKDNINKDEDVLIAKLLKEFPQYGLGDLQYKMLIREVLVNNKENIER